MLRPRLQALYKWPSTAVPLSGSSLLESSSGSQIQVGDAHPFGNGATPEGLEYTGTAEINAHAEISMAV